MIPSNRKEKIELLKLLEERDKRNAMKNPIYDCLKKFKGRIVVLMGGSGSGKSYAIADYILDRIVQEENKKPHRILCVRAEHKQVSESQFPLLKARAAAKYPNLNWQINKAKGHEKISLGDNEILFAGLDNVEKLKSIFDITSVWVEEADQTKPEDFRELNRRLRGFDGLMQIYISLNPVSQLCWIKKDFFDTRNERTVTLAGADPFEDFKRELPDNLDDRITEIHEGVEVESAYYDKMLVHTTFKDNRFIDAEYAKQMAELKSNPEEHMVYALGHWGVLGDIYFHKNNIARRMREIKEPARSIIFEYDVGFIKDSRTMVIENQRESEGNVVHILKEPEKNVPYVIGGDTAGDGSDWNTAIVRNNITGEEVAYIRTQLDETPYAEQVLCLGYMYNTALIGLEMNYSTLPMKRIAKDFAYPKIYVRGEAIDKFTEKSVGKYGFHTNASTRPYILGKLRDIVRETPEMITDYETLNEMTTFVRNEKSGKPEAKAGYHDDMIMAWAITEGIRHQQSTGLVFAEKNPDLSKVPNDYMDDYNSSPDHLKPLLLKRFKELGYID